MSVCACVLVCMRVFVFIYIYIIYYYVCVYVYVYVYVCECEREMGIDDIRESVDRDVSIGWGQYFIYDCFPQCSPLTTYNVRSAASTVLPST